MKLSPITDTQWEKILKALVYSFASGFFGYFLITAAGVLQSPTGLSGLDIKAVEALLAASVVAGINTLAVAVKELFSES